MKWLQSVRARPWVPVAVLVASASTLYAPALVGGRIFFDFDTLNEGYAYAAHFSTFPGAWDQALYTNAYHSGANVGSNPIFNLYGLLFTLKPSFIADTTFFHWLVFGFFTVFLIFTYVFFRDRDFRPWTAAALAALVGFSERYVLTIFPLLYVGSYLVFPAFCVVLLRLRKRFRLTTVLLGGLLAALSLLFGYMSLLLLFAVPLAAYAITLWFDVRREDRKRARTFAWGVLAIAAIGIALSAWQLVPIYRLAQDTPRGTGLSFAESQEEVLRFTDLPRLVLPSWTLYASGEGTLYASILGLVFVLLSLRSRAKTREESFWRWTLLLSLFFAVKWSPLAWLANKLPLLNSLRSPSRVLFFALIAFAFLAGRGIEGTLENREAARTGRVASMLRFGLLGLIAAIFAGTLADLLGGFRFATEKLISFFDAKYYAKTTGLPLEHYHNVIRQMVDGVRSAVSATDPATAVALACAIAAFFLLFRAQRVREGYVAAILIVGSAFFAVARVIPLQDVSASAVRDTPAAARYILSQPDHDLYRTFSLFYASSKFENLDAPAQGRAAHADQVAYARDLLAVNMHLRYGTQSIDGYDNFMTRRTSNLLNEVLSESMPTGNRIAQAKTTRAEKIALFESRLNVVGMMNVKYVLTAHELADARLTPVWTGETTSRAIPIRLYENAEVLPRAFLAKRVTLVPSDEAAALAEVLKPNRNFHEETLLECGDCSLVESTSTAERVEISSYAPGDVRLKTFTTTPRLLVFNENRLRGWQAKVDGQTVPTYFANYLYQGVIVPAGEHDVRFTYGRP
ncbi:MAG TPA: hypothetical protein VN397_00035 [Candidatus Methylomirabilis sp.]|nr:hypothetical protein [Candidatus Methylomirabilis sp.]